MKDITDIIQLQTPDQYAIITQNGLLGKKILVSIGKYPEDVATYIVIDKTIEGYRVSKYGSEHGEHGYVDATGENYGGMGYKVIYLCADNDGNIIRVNDYDIVKVIL